MQHLQFQMTKKNKTNGKQQSIYMTTSSLDELKHKSELASKKEKNKRNYSNINNNAEFVIETMSQFFFCNITILIKSIFGISNATVEQTDTQQLLDE